MGLKAVEVAQYMSGVLGENYFTPQQLKMVKANVGVQVAKVRMGSVQKQEDVVLIPINPLK